MAEHPDPLVALLHKHGIGCHPTAERGDFRHHEAAAFWLRDAGAGQSIAEINRLRNIADAAQAVVDFWEGPPYVTDDDEISREIDHLRRALESA